MPHQKYLLQLLPDEKISAVISIKEFEEDKYLFMATKDGTVKKTPILEYANIRKTGLQAITLRDGNELIEVKVTDNNRDIFLVTKRGQCIRFNEKDVRTTGRTSIGVRGMKIDEGDEVVAMQMDIQGPNLLMVSEFGMGKRTSIDEFPQFFNVLKGDMSIVGTRPPLISETNLYELHHRARLAIKPGITGLWQVSGRSDITDFEEVVRLDREYIENWDIELDLKILLKTVMVVIRKDGSV